MTLDTFKKLMDEYTIDLAKNDSADDWSADARKWAEEKGYIKGDTNGHKMYKKPLTREEFVTVLYRILNGEEKI